MPREKFFDRREEIEFFIQYLRVKRKMLLCIVAPLKYGKSSLLLRYYEILKEHPDIVPVYINLKEIEEPIRLIVDTLRSYGIDLESEYERARHRGILSIFFNAINRKLGGKWLFLLFDEFHLLPSRVRGEGFLRSFDDKNIFGFFRGYAEGKNISYIVCGSVIEPLMKALDVWGGRFQTLYLGPFSERDAIEMLKKLFKEGGMTISDEDAKIIAEAAGYHPFYIQYVGHHIYMIGEINRFSIRKSKHKLFEFVTPIFVTYINRLSELGKQYIATLVKILREELLSVDELAIASDLLRMGLIRPKNAGFEIVDPLFKRYMEIITQNLGPSEVVVVGHWAERIVGNYLLRKGYMPYYSHDSRGAFDIYVKIKGVDVGIQIKYTSTGEIYLTEEEANLIIKSAEENKWIPILAVVSREVKFFKSIRQGKYTADTGEAEIEKLIMTMNQI